MTGSAAIDVYFPERSSVSVHVVRNIGDEDDMVRIELEDGTIECNAVMSRETFVRLLVAGRRHLKTGRRSVFYQGEYREGDGQEKTTHPAAEVLRSESLYIPDRRESDEPGAEAAG